MRDFSTGFDIVYILFYFIMGQFNLATGWEIQRYFSSAA
jgi:hypothetical protein